ncbi:hypothetical protein MKW92_048061 [Papaver armeniacum]|nr:hypothetical protein MKW92_048061 [Papaver armeniacum]
MERAEKEEEMENSEDVNNMERLPEGCISAILSLTTPADVCRSSLVSTLFKSAADSDALWEKFLPANYQEIISRASNPISSAAAPSKKELYYRLSDDPLLIDDGNIIQLLSPNTFYVAYLVLKLRDDASGFDDYEPIKAKVEVVGRDGDTSACSKERLIYLCAGDEHSSSDPLETEYFARERGDGWMEVEMGHFFNEGGVREGGEVHMSVHETERGVHKRGLIVQGMELRRGRVSASSFTYASTSQASTGSRGGRGSRGRRGGRRGRGLVQQTYGIPW